MANKSKALLEVLSWNKSLAAEMEKISPKLTAIINKCNLDDSYKLYRVKYPYGATIFKDGVLFLPNRDGELIPINDSNIPKEIQKDLSYKPIPMGLVLKASTEVYMEDQERIIPLTVFKEGSLFGTWESLTLEANAAYFIKLAWSMSSGGRTVFCLSKLSEVEKLTRLQREFGLKSFIPKKFKDHHQLFTNIINSPSCKDKWYSEILLFSTKWHDLLHKENDYLELQNYFFRYAWQQSVFWRTEITLNLMWQKFVAGLREQHIKCDNYQLESLKHIVAVGVGALPVIKAADCNDQGVAPIPLLQQVLMENYRLPYIPTIMHADYFLMNTRDDCGYYSVNEPTLIETIPRYCQIQNISAVTRGIKFLFESFKQYVLDGVFQLENTPIYTFIKNVDVNFYHTDFDSSNQLLTSDKLGKNDQKLLSVLKGYGNREFCFSSLFFRGCVRFSNKKIEE